MAGTWAAFVAGSIAGWVKRALVGAGIGTVTYVGFTALKAQVASAVNSAMSGLVGDVYSVLALAGFVDLVGIYLGVMTAMLALIALKRFQLLTQ